MQTVMMRKAGVVAKAPAAPRTVAVRRVSVVRRAGAEGAGQKTSVVDEIVTSQPPDQGRGSPQTENKQAQKPEQMAAPEGDKAIEGQKVQMIEKQDPKDIPQAGFKAGGVDPEVREHEIAVGLVNPGPKDRNSSPGYMDGGESK